VTPADQWQSEREVGATPQRRALPLTLTLVGDGSSSACRGLPTGSAVAVGLRLRDPRRAGCATGPWPPCPPCCRRASRRPGVRPNARRTVAGVAHLLPVGQGPVVNEFPRDPVRVLPASGR
jgi:hypothetical protein